MTWQRLNRQFCSTSHHGRRTDSATKTTAEQDSTCSPRSHWSVEAIESTSPSGSSKESSGSQPVNPKACGVVWSVLQYLKTSLARWMIKRFSLLSPTTVLTSDRGDIET